MSKSVRGPDNAWFFSRNRGKYMRSIDSALFLHFGLWYVLLVTHRYWSRQYGERRKLWDLLGSFCFSRCGLDSYAYLFRGFSWSFHFCWRLKERNLGFVVEDYLKRNSWSVWKFRKRKVWNGFYRCAWKRKRFKSALMVDKLVGHVSSLGSVMERC